jgi:hypothetical protein
MSEGTVAFPSNTICYFDKPPAAKAESDAVNNSGKNSPGVANADATGSVDKPSLTALKPVDAAGAAASLDERGNVATPGPSINTDGQIIGTLVNEVA